MTVTLATHPDFVVESAGSGEFASFLRTLKDFSKGDILGYLNKATPNKKTYTSVQRGKGPGDNIEFNSTFPNIVVDLTSKDSANWHIRALVDIEAGSIITFFYPSTEWEMTQPFECNCGAKSCLRRIQGAKILTHDEVAIRGWLSPWIEELMNEREQTAQT
ncbi:hypothetical protein C8J57DRAFT_1723735 [Mycena rebaudengoi]|nr:hypothetical protein C8J57DRAFT_1723735 [Mycena rebaudengoi]